MQVKCPRCGKTTNYSLENAFRPFCSERCQLLDLGAWADEDYRISHSEQESAAVNAEDDPPSPKQQLN